MISSVVFQQEINPKSNKSKIDATSYGSYNSAYSYDANGNIQTLKRNGTAENLEMDDLTYHYFAETNKLQYITDNVAATNYDIDIDDQSPKNYYYDKTGNLIQDVSEEIGTIKWTSTGKVREVKRYPPDNEKPDLEFFYDASDNRTGKLTKSNINDKKTWKYTFYSRDHSGNIMATYNIQYNNDTNLYVLSLKEQMLYGSNLLGIYNDSVVIGFSNYIKFNPDNHLAIIHNTLQMNELPVLDEQQSYLDTNYFATMHKYHGFTGKIQYGLKNHLGNVHTTISDKPLLKDVTGNGLADEKRAIILSSRDFYPFGMLMPGRNYNAMDYRFGFNGQEKDDEIFGITGSFLNFTFRGYDSRTGRFWSIDPLAKKYPYWTPYQFAGLTPIQARELEGLEVYYSTREWGSCGGLGQFGWGYAKGSGVAKDVIGTTYFKYKTKITISDNESVAGFNPIYASKHWGVDLSSNTFEESIKKIPTTSISMSPIFSGSIEGREGDAYIGLSVGVGIGGAHTTFETEVTESFSLTKKDISEVMEQFGKSGHKILSSDRPEYFEHKKERKSYLGYKLPRSLFGSSIEIKTDINITNVGDEKKLRWQTKRYQKRIKQK